MPDLIWPFILQFTFQNFYCMSVGKHSDTLLLLVLTKGGNKQVFHVVKNYQ